MTTTIVNLTPHTLNIIACAPPYKEGAITTSRNQVIPPSGSVARVESTTRTVGKVMLGDAAIPITTAEYGDVTGLPDPVRGTIYIVSGMVAARTSRDDVFSPGEQVRDCEGNVVGCRTLIRASHVVENGCSHNGR